MPRPKKLPTDVPRRRYTLTSEVSDRLTRALIARVVPDATSWASEVVGQRLDQVWDEVLRMEAVTLQQRRQVAARPEVIGPSPDSSSAP